MSGHHKPKGGIRFGVFEVDLAGVELRKRGRRVKLQDLPFRLLVALLERPGEVFTREELRERLWGDTVVDFQEGLHTAVRKLRAALGDSAHNSRFIETVPKHGYRFIAPVTAPEQSAKPPDANPMRKWAAVAVAVGLATIAVVHMWPRQPAEAERTPSFHSRPLTSYPGAERAPSFSPDGRQVAFTWNGPDGDNFDIYTQDVEGGSPLRVTTDPARDYDPDWSPDGNSIAFTRNNEVFVVPPFGGTETRVTHVAGEGVSWSPDGRSLAVSDRESDGEPLGIFLVSVESGEKRRLTNPENLGVSDQRPTFSPDGKHVAFMREATVIREIYVVPVSGGPARRATEVGRSMVDVDWTPDGKELVFDIWMAGIHRAVAHGPPSRTPDYIDATGEDALQPTVSLPTDTRPAQLAYTRESRDWNILSMRLGATDADSAKAVPIAGSTRFDSEPSISPDGRRLAFASGRTGTAQIWVCDADGSDARQLTRFDEGLSATAPQWSPDGEWIAFDVTHAGNRDVYVVRSDGGLPRQMTSEPSIDAQPSWSANGRWVYFMSDRSGNRQIWKIPADGGDPAQVTRNGGYQAEESPDGERLIWAKWRSRGLWHMPVDGGPEELLVEAAWVNFWSITKDSLYYLDFGDTRPAEEVTVPELPVMRFDLRSGERSLVATVTGRFTWGTQGLSVARDESWIAWAMLEGQDADLMIIEDFR